MNTILKIKLAILGLGALLLISSCSNSNSNDEEICLSCDEEEQMELESKDRESFNKEIVSLYDLIGTDPEKVINETDRLLEQVNSSADSNYQKSIKLSSLHELRAETFYRLGNYQKSIDEIYDGHNSLAAKAEGDSILSENDYIHLACNYVKLNELDKAKNYLEQAKDGWYITPYIWGNYYEVIGNKAKAIEVYQSIQQNDNSDDYIYYKDAQARLKELEKPNPKLLTELYYPSYRPDDADVTMGC